ncbi:MAG TPA: TonB-dependent receptor [Sphingobium sp.]|nr:TonB-dependent receptor [Sphingobium sp.]
MKTGNTMIGHTLRVALLASTVSLGAMTWAAPAFAQDGETAQRTEDQAIVITGSRIVRKDYDSNSPTITVDSTFLKESTTSAVEQSLNKLPQFTVSQSSTVKNSEGTLSSAGSDIQPNATNTPGAATVSLRGVGANRSLVLIDGRRGTPGNASGTVDISTIPSSALERVEVISGGASATYGADAVAGVTNFILRKNFKGLELDGQVGLNQYGDGLEYQFSGIVGGDIADGRGNVSLAMSYNQREYAYQRDLPWYRDIWNNPDSTAGAFFIFPRPGVSGLGQPGNGTAATSCNQLPTGCVITDYFASRGATIPVPNDTGTLYLNPDGSLFTNSFAARGGGAGFLQPWPDRDGEFQATMKGTSVGTVAAINGLTPSTVPTTRYNFLAQGNYEVNDWIKVFGQAMFSNSTTYTVQEPGPLSGGWSVLIPWGNGVYDGTVTVPGGPVSYVNPTAIPQYLAGGGYNPAFQSRYGSILPCAAAGTGCTNTQVFEAVVPQDLQTILNGRTDPNAPFTLSGFLPIPRATYSDVTTWSMIGGLEGNIPGTDWTWEAFVNHGVSVTSSRQTGMYSLERVRAVLTSPNFGQNFSYQGNAFGNGGGLSGAGFGASTGTCTSGLDFFGGYAGLTDDCKDAIAADVSNRSKTTQTIVEANLQGGLIDLPAGQLRAAIGASYRENKYEFVNETLSTAGRSYLDQVIGIYPSMNMENSGITSKEFYGELLIPLIRDTPFIKSFGLEVGGRISDYNTTGTSYTFKVLGDWEVNNWLRFRGGFNRAERAPNIAELMLTPQQAFRTDAVGDVCSTNHSNAGSANPSQNPGGALSVQAICLALMQRDNGGVYVPTTDQYSFYEESVSDTRQPLGGGNAFSYAVGNQYYRENLNANVAALKPEVADTWTVGAVIRSPFDGPLLRQLSLTVDYFNITINDPIGAIGAGGVLLRCVSPDLNPAAANIAAGATTAADLDADFQANGPISTKAKAAILDAACPLAYRAASNGPGATGALDSARIFGTYTNDGKIALSGIDATLSWGADVGPGRMFASINGNYMLHFKVQDYAGGPFLDYVGTAGTSLKGVNQGASFQYRLISTLGYSWNGLNASIQWQHTPATDGAGDVNFLNGVPGATMDDFTGVPSYDLFNLNLSYRVTQDVSVRFGVDNLFNRWPAITNVRMHPNAATGQLPGGSFSFFQDLQGRRFSLGINAKF